MGTMRGADGWLERTGTRRLTLGAALLLAGACILLYLPSFSFPWIYDDLPLVVENPDIRSLAGFWADTVPGRPLRELTLLLDYRLFGLAPAGYHLQNLLWHLACGGMLLLLVRKVWSNDWTALAAAALFLFHPLCVEVLAQASHRKDSLCLFFSLAALVCWVEHYRAAAPWRWRLFALLLVAIAYQAKQNALAVLPLFLLYDQLAVSRERRLFRLDRRTVLVTVIAGGGIAFLTLSLVLSVGGEDALRLSGYYLQVLKGNAFMLSKGFLPVGLSPEYTLIPPRGFFDPWVLGAVALVAGCVLLFRIIDNGGWRFFLCSVPLLLLPTANLLGQVAYAAADRYMYAPLAGLAALVAWGLAHFPWRNLLLAGLLMLLAAGSLVQQRVWSSPLNFYQRIHTANPFVGVSSRSSLTLLNLAGEYRKAGRTAEAIASYRQCFEQTALKHEAMLGLAALYEAAGNPAAAAAALEQAVAVAGARADSLAYLVALTLKVGEPAKAEGLALRYLTLFPPQADVLSNLGVACEKRGDLERAAGYHRHALELDADYWVARFNLAQVLIKQKNYAEGIVELRRVVAQRPEDARALYALGEQLVVTGRLREVPPLIERLRALDDARALRLQDTADRAAARDSR